MSDKLQRTLARFEARITAGDFYEAHQTLRTIANRYVKSKQYQEAIDLLYQGSIILSTNKEYASASDLIIYLVSVYEESNAICSNDPDHKIYKLKLIELINQLPNNDPSLFDLAKTTLNWSKNSNAELKFGDSDLHNLFGVKLLNSLYQPVGASTEKRKLFDYCELHLILGGSEALKAYVDYLFKWFQQSNEDPGVFLARAVINYAYLKNLSFMRSAIDRFIAQLVTVNTEYEVIEYGQHKIYYFSEYQLINFLQLLCLTLTKRESGTRFLKLYDQYKPVIVQNQLQDAVDYLGRFYFGLKLGNPNGGGNMLANMMSGLFK